MDRRRAKRKRRGSERTQDGSERTRSQSEDTFEDEEFDLAAQYMEPSEGWWNRYGFKSFGEYLRYSEIGPDRPIDLTARPKKKIPAPKLPTGDSPARGSDRRVRTRQVSIRLDDDGYEDLVRAARIYGVAPATMGRLLVQKGSRKALESA